MGIFDKQIKVLKEFNRNPGHTIIELSKQFEAEILDYITDNQLFQGKDSDDKEIAPPYTAFTISVKQGKGQPTDRVTLRDEGDFYDRMELDFRPGEFAVVNSDSRLRSLEQKYGNKILGLSRDGVDELIILVKPELLSYLRTQLTKI